MQLPIKIIINTLSTSYIRCPADLEALVSVPELSALEFEDEAEKEEDGETVLEDEEVPGSFDDGGSKITPDDESNTTTTA